MKALSEAELTSEAVLAEDTDQIANRTAHFVGQWIESTLLKRRRRFRLAMIPSKNLPKNALPMQNGRRSLPRTFRAKSAISRNTLRRRLISETRREPTGNFHSGH